MSKKTDHRIMFVAIAFILTLGVHPFPARSQDPTIRIESDDTLVSQSGNWTAQSTPDGNYLYSSGNEGDILTLKFDGPSIEVIYISGPSLGTLAIELDGTVLRTVITTADTTQFAQSAKVAYLSNEPHTLKVYAQAGGIIAVDAFLVTSISEADAIPTQSVDETLVNSEDGGIQSSTCAPVSVTHRVSLTDTGAQSDNGSYFPSLSADGRFIAFQSLARLVPTDSDSFYDIYVYDRQTCEVQLISVSSAGVKGSGRSDRPNISDNGRYVAFSSLATNLVAGDTNTYSDVFVHDRQTGTTTRVSIATGGVQSNGFSWNAAISGDGRYIAFDSTASNLGAGDTNNEFDVFVHDRQTGITTCVSIMTGGVPGDEYSARPALSSDGRFVAFESATQLVANDTNALTEIFVRDRQTSTTTRVSIVTGGIQSYGGNSVLASISSDGRYVAFESTAMNLVPSDNNLNPDIFVHDRQTTTTTRVSVATGGTEVNFGSSLATISGDGRYVVFQSWASNLVSGDTNGVQDVFVHDRASGITRRLSLSSTNLQPSVESIYSDISKDGRYVAFYSGATNLVVGDTNTQIDVFVTATAQPPTDKLALFQTSLTGVNLLNTLQDNPPYTAYTYLSAHAPINGGRWVMGDWNGDGLKTPGIYTNGPFYYTNRANESSPNDWSSLWIGIAGPPVAGRFNGSLVNDCIGAIQTSASGGQTVFVLYFTCDLSGAATPAISSQWLSAVLPDSGGFSGVYQFGAGDFDGNAVDSIAVRRGPYVAFGNVAPTTGPAQFNFAQFIGAPVTSDIGIFLVGNWDGDIYDSFGLFYQNGEFFYRNDLLFNSGAYGNQTIAPPFAGTMQAATWR